MEVNVNNHDEKSTALIFKLILPSEYTLQALPLQEYTFFPITNRRKSLRTKEKKKRKKTFYIGVTRRLTQKLGPTLHFSYFLKKKIKIKNDRPTDPTKAQSSIKFVKRLLTF